MSENADSCIQICIYHIHLSTSDPRFRSSFSLCGGQIQSTWSGEKKRERTYSHQDMSSVRTGMFPWWLISIPDVHSSNHTLLKTGVLLLSLPKTFWEIFLKNINKKRSYLFMWLFSRSTVGHLFLSRQSWASMTSGSGWWIHWSRLSLCSVFILILGDLVFLSNSKSLAQCIWWKPRFIMICTKCLPRQKSLSEF